MIEENSSLFREVAVSFSIVALIGLIILTVSGVWPPLVAIESESMEPNLSKGDLIFVVDQDRLIPEMAYDDTGIVTQETGNQTRYQSYGDGGDVIIYYPNGNTSTTPVIHRAMFWVEQGEDWYDKADKDYIGDASNCEQLNNCPAPNDGFITKGDYNTVYDQSFETSTPVSPDWILGTAELRIPWLGWIRLLSVSLITMLMALESRLFYPS